jgi:hydroxyacylglutathione hydrolase
LLLRKVKSEGLAHLSYLVGSDGKAAVIDPRRDCQIYLDIADEDGLRISHVLETHRNEDYVTGSCELASMTGAPIHHGDLDFGYGRLIREGDEIDLGQALLRAISTPGHTPESMSYALVDRTAGPEVIGVFTGDALFVGEVGRTDLLGHDRIDELAAMLFDSLHHKLLTLGTGTIIYPAHGAGSACGGSISNREESTIGLEISQNKALEITDKENFVAMKRQEKIERPFYFSTMEEINLRGPPVLGHLPRPPSLSPDEFGELASDRCVVLDVRVPTSFASAHIEGALSIPMEVMPNYAGWMIGYDRPLLLVMDENGDVQKVVSELVRIGYTDIAGYLRDGMEGWTKAGQPAASFPAITAQELNARREAGEDIFILDVRMNKEWSGERVQGATHIFIGYLEKQLEEVPRDRPVAVMCSSGLRGSLGASVLQRNGYCCPINVLGGMGGWKKAGLPVSK